MVLMWTLISNIYTLAFWVVFSWFIVVPNKIIKKVKHGRAWFSITWLILAISSHSLVIFEVNHQFQYLASKLYRVNAVNEFSLRDKCSIYGLNIIMGLSALTIYPHVASETLYMMIPPPGDGLRVFESNFPLGSKKIQAVIQKISKKLKTHSQLKQQLLKQQISWNTKQYLFGNTEAAYALALNPAKLSVLAIPQGDYWKLEVLTLVKISYPKRSQVILIQQPELKLEEGLFWLLQQAGWLHTYTAEWRSSLIIPR